MVSSRGYSRTIAWTLCVLFSFSTSAFSAPPNIILIYADDWGWGDLAIHGHPALKTPNLDRLARAGTDFHQFTVANPVCSPSRAAILTGQFPSRHGIHQHFSTPSENKARGMPNWLDPKLPLLPKLLRSAGYITGHFGKWHLGGGGANRDAPLPVEYGFDDAAVWMGPGQSVFGNTRYRHLVDTGYVHREENSVYLTRAAVDHALRFVRSAKDRPFYLNLWIHETHYRVAATDTERAQYPDIEEPQRTYYSAITRADAEIGRLLDLLDELDLTDRSIVIFASDNGPETTELLPHEKFYYSVGETAGLRGRKRSLYLGGVNVPFLVRWPGVVPAGRVDHSSVISGVDMMPTLLAIAGVQPPSDYVSDGQDVRAALSGDVFLRSRPIFWEWRGGQSNADDWPKYAVRSGNFVLLHDEEFKRVELYDVVEDRGQQKNIAARLPGKVAELRERLIEWRATLPSNVMDHTAVNQR